MTATYSPSIAYNISLSMDPANGVSWTSINDLIDIDMNNTVKTDFGDSTLLGQKFKTALPASIDPGSFSFTIGWDPSDTGTGSTYGMIGAQQASQAIASFKITVTYASGSGGSGSATEIHHGYIESMDRQFGKTKLSAVKVTVKLVGDPELAGVD